MGRGEGNSDTHVARKGVNLNQFKSANLDELVTVRKKKHHQNLARGWTFSSSELLQQEKNYLRGYISRTKPFDELKSALLNQPSPAEGAERVKRVLGDIYEGYMKLWPRNLGVDPDVVRSALIEECVEGELKTVVNTVDPNFSTTLAEGMSEELTERDGVIEIWKEKQAAEQTRSQEAHQAHQERTEAVYQASCVEVQQQLAAFESAMENDLITVSEQERSDAFQRYMRSVYGYLAQEDPTKDTSHLISEMKKYFSTQGSSLHKVATRYGVHISDEAYILAKQIASEEVADSVASGDSTPRQPVSS